jgi:hypothetical protein
MTDIHISFISISFFSGPLCYFSEHLLWLQDDRNAVIGDLNGQNAAVISGTSLSNLNMVAVLDPVLHQYPSKYATKLILSLFSMSHTYIVCRQIGDNQLGFQQNRSTTDLNSTSVQYQKRNFFYY